MYLHFIKYFLIFNFLTLYAYSSTDAKQISKEEEIKDTIVVHGMILHGRVMNIGPKTLSFKLLYSEGVNHIPYKDITSIDTKYTYHISFQRMNIEGRIVGIEDNKYLKIIEGENQRTIKISDIDNFVIAVSDDDSFENKIRNKFPYTKGTISTGFEIEKGTSEKNKLDILLKLKHIQAEHEIQLYVDYEFETTQTDTTSKVQNKDELVSILTYKNNFKNNEFYYASLSADYDRPRRILTRYIPAVGYGYRFRFHKARWLEPTVGIGYATTRYTDTLYPDKNFAVAAFGLTGKYQVDNISYINSLILDGFLMYYPAISTPESEWIFRSNVTLTVPLFNFFSIKLLYDWRNDSNPDPNVGNNKTTTKLLFGLDF